MCERGILADCDVQLGVLTAVIPDGFFGLGLAYDIGDDGILERGTGWDGAPICWVV